MADLYGTYDKRIKFTIDNTKIDATLTWIPITVLLTSTAGEEVFVELDEDSDFDKCAFTKSDGTTELYADCEKYDVSGEVAIYHVSLDGWEISSSGDTDFYMYYDDDASANTGKISKSGGTAAQSVYDANFKAVYHMHDGEPTYDTQYDAAVEPDSDGWTLGGTDYASVSAGILTIDTSASDIYTCYYYKTPDVDFNAGFYLKMRVKASTDMDDVSDALLIQIQDGTQNEQFKMWIRDGEVSYFHEPNTTVDIAIDTTTAYVTYEIYIKGSNFYIYMDGVQKALQTLDAETVTDLVQFGDPLGSPTMCKAEIDYVYYALGVTDNPLLTIYDSTSNNNDGTKKGVGEPAEVTGKVGQGQDFDGSDDVITFPCTALSTTDYTIEAVFQAEDSTDVYVTSPTHEVVDATTQYLFPRISVYDAGEVIYIQRDASGSYTVPWTPDANWTLVSWIRTSGTISGYIDGASQVVSESGSDFSQDGHDFTDTEFWVGRFHAFGTHYYSKGLLDEYRISNSARAAAWVKATYESLWDSLLTYGNEETSGVVVDNAIFFGCNF